TNEVRGVNRVIFTCSDGIDSVSLKKAVVSRDRVDLLREADAIVMQKLEQTGLMKEVWQFPTVLLPLSVNGTGESVVLRPVYSKRAMTAKFADLPWAFVDSVSREIRQLKGIGAVFYDVTNKPPGTIEWE
ncbi:MAG: glutamine-hydrolyzing GMP synthase, partial [Candidatus Diapherotrites archaeon]|nr:glutamine-hydrolyzing GMP synthase [Candidatus Diapherotrites archaeon]